MKLRDIKKFAKKRASKKTPASSAVKNVYGGVGYHNHQSVPTPPVGGGSGEGSSGGDGGGE